MHWKTQLMYSDTIKLGTPSGGGAVQVLGECIIKPFAILSTNYAFNCVIINATHLNLKTDIQFPLNFGINPITYFLSFS